MANINVRIVKETENRVELLGIKVVLDQVSIAFFNGLKLDKLRDFCFEMDFEKLLFIEFFEYISG